MDTSSVIIPPPSPAVERSTVAATMDWLWKDTFGRVVPFAVAAGIYAKMTGEGAAGVGLPRSTARQLFRDAALGSAIGVPLMGLAIAFRGWVAPRYRLPTPADQALQTTFYLAVNAPAEELFWRGFLQTLAIRSVGRVRRWLWGVARRKQPAARHGAQEGAVEQTTGEAVDAALGWAITTAVFGAYHRLGGWSWRSIAGVTAAGGVFGAVYLAQRKRRSLVPSIIIHGLATAGFLSWGDAALHAFQRARRTTT